MTTTLRVGTLVLSNDYRHPVALAKEAATIDVLSDGLSLVYSFYEPGLAKNSLGSFVILDHVVQARIANLPYVYLGYWVQGSEKMDYKARFRPLEILRPGGWTALNDEPAER